MATLTPLQPFVSGEPTVLVENKLPPGSFRFQLVCVDEAGNESAPAEITVNVREAVQINPDIFRTRILAREPIEREPIGRTTIARPAGLATKLRMLRP
jgi:hypothetical protein